MAIFLINCSNLKQGGGLQVADSVCRELKLFQQHYFVVVLSSSFPDTLSVISDFPNIELYTYDIQNNLKTLFLGRDAYLDGLVEEKKVDAVLTIFGPSRWRPRCKHLCGFARAQLIKNVNPNVNANFRERLTLAIWRWGFRRSSDTFYTENQYISSMLPKLLGDVRVFTVTNYYNQVFDKPELWKKKTLPDFDGVTLLTISNAYPHKKLEIAAEVTRILKKEHPDFRFRFVYSIEREQLKADLSGIEEHFVFIGTVDISECPSLYRQSDIAFQPTLMECFTATYPEAMRMEVPIVTTDLEFARGLCGDAACYYSAMDAKSCAEAIYKMATDKEYVNNLVVNGKKQLKNFDNYEQRAEKLVMILEDMVSKKADSNGVIY